MIYFLQTKNDFFGNPLRLLKVRFSIIHKNCWPQNLGLQRKQKSLRVEKPKVNQIADPTWFLMIGIKINKIHFKIWE